MQQGERVCGHLGNRSPGSPDLKEFKANGEPAKYVIRPAAGPLGATVKGPDTDTLDAYLNLFAGS